VLPTGYGPDPAVEPPLQWGSSLDPVKGKYLLRTYGCQMNEHDSERIAGLLEADGYEPTTDLEEADVVMLNTCCIRENADNKLYGALGHLKAEKERRPDMQIAVGGCLAQKDKDLVATKAGHVDVVFGTHNVHRAAELLSESREQGQIVEILEAAVDAEHAAFPSALPEKREVDYAAWVTIQIGCDNSCAFCIVPSVRGPEISRPFGDLVREVEHLASDGVAEITLLGQNVNSYGRDITLKLGGRDADDLDAHEAGVRWTEGGRRRGRPLFSDLLRTLEVAAEAGYDSAYTFVFSPREGTEAAEMDAEFIPQPVTKERMERLRHVIERSAAAKNAARVGRIEEVVVEGPSKRNPGVISGRTRQNKLVHFEGDLRAGSLATVEVTEAATHYLMGELRETLRGPKVRTRIPVVAG